jgi:Na+/H+-translocating membrane pyrophosphatase
VIVALCAFQPISVALSVGSRHDRGRSSPPGSDLDDGKWPDYARVVGISTRSAQKELVPLATISVLAPLMIGLILQVEALGFR